MIGKVIDKAHQGQDDRAEARSRPTATGVAMAASGNIYVDLFHRPDADEDRLKCWEMFQTLSTSTCTRS